MLKTKFFLIFIIILAFVLRFWQLGAVPISPDWDEVSLGYNAYSLLTTGKDEYGSFLPVALKSFGDYKPALYAYLTIPSVAVFGISTFAVRFPSAVFGLISILITFFLVKELFKNEKIAFLSSFLLAISPWHIQFSRTGFEANLGVFFNLLTALLFIKGLKKPYLLLLSGIASGFSIYTYQSEKIFAPLFMLTLILIYRKDLISVGKKYVLPFLIVGILVVFPMIFSIAKNPDSLNRVKSTSFTSENKFFSHTPERIEIDRANKDYLGLIIDNRRVVFLRQSIGAYLSHFDPNWLFLKGDLPRHHTPNMGILYLWELPFILIGLYFLVFEHRFSRKTKIFIISWFLISPIPASVTNDVPHAVRTLNFLPTHQIFTALGIYVSIEWLLKSVKLKSLRNGIILVGIFVVTLNFIYYLNQYFVQQNYYYSKDWQYGYEEAVSYTANIANNYRKIVVSSEVPMDQSYMFFLFYLKYPPSNYQLTDHTVSDHDFDKFEFRKIDWEKDKNLEKTLFVGTPAEIKDGNVLKTINYLNGENAIIIAEPKAY